MKALPLILSIVLSFLLVTCKDHGVSPPTSDPPGRQRDIPWPSLANSPWPMYHGNPQSTGRSRFAGPMFGSTAWSIDSIYCETGAIIGTDSTIYVGGTSTSFQHYLYCIGLNGVVEWKFDVGTRRRLVVTPLVAADGTIYVGATDGTLYALHSDGTQKWTFTADGQLAQAGMNIGLDGTLYFSSLRPTLYALNPDGTMKWQLADGRFAADDMTFSPDGKTLYFSASTNTVIAVDVVSQAVKWTYGRTPFVHIAPLVDSYGHVYATGYADSVAPGPTPPPGRPMLTCLNPDGTVRWSFIRDAVFDLHLAPDPTIDADGNICLALDTLYSLDFSGTIRWKMPLDKWASTPLVCDLNGTVYLAVRNGIYNNEVLAVSSAGSKAWAWMFDSFQQTGPSPALGYAGSLLLQTWRSSRIYAIR